jgi:hypothetical protein
MKTALQSYRNQQIKLVIDEPGVPRNEKAVLAMMEIYEGAGVWTLVDVRLHQHGQVGPWFDVGAHHFHANYQAPNARSAELARGLLRECTPSLDRKNPLVQWCTFEGIVRGKKPSEMGVSSCFITDDAKLHTRKEAMAHMETIAKFWADCDISETDPDVREKANSVKIENPWRQPTDIGLAMLVDKTMGVVEAAKAAIPIKISDTCPQKIAESLEEKLFYHVTPIKNLKDILNAGIVPSIGPRSEQIGETEPKIYLFRSIEDVENALMNWMSDAFDEDQALVILEIKANSALLAQVNDCPDNFEVTSSLAIKPSCIGRVFNEEMEELGPRDMERFIKNHKKPGA